MYLSKNKILVAGLGNTGLSVLRYCQHINANVAAYDAQMTSAQQQQFHKQFPHIPLFTGDIHHALIVGEVSFASLPREEPVMPRSCGGSGLRGERNRNREAQASSSEGSQDNNHQIALQFAKFAHPLKQVKANWEEEGNI